jgi:hypothetical protein
MSKTAETTTIIQNQQPQPMQPTQQPDLVDRFLDSPLPEAEMRKALANGVLPIYATCRLQIASLIRGMGAAAGAQKAFNFASSTVRARDPKGNLDFHCALARAAVKRVESDLARIES